MTDLIKIDDVQPLDGHWLRLTFSDGAIKDVDLGELLNAGGVFAPIAGRCDVFEGVRVNQETRTIEWPGDVDLDPDILYGTFEPASRAHGPPADRARTDPGDDSGRPARRRSAG